MMYDYLDPAHKAQDVDQKEQFNVQILDAVALL
jgi:hypothetical protein